MTTVNADGVDGSAPGPPGPPELPGPPGSPDPAQPRRSDAASLARNSAVMAIGTIASRGTGVAQPLALSR